MLERLIEQHFPWYIDCCDITNIDCQCGVTCEGMAGWADHASAEIKGKGYLK
jgi:hypothetical protein